MENNNIMETYKERHIRWQNTTINQLGYANNIIITLAIAFLSFVYDKKLRSTFTISLDAIFSWKLF